jgi:Protein of unknown function (DUF3499)
MPGRSRKSHTTAEGTKWRSRTAGASLGDHADAPTLSGVVRHCSRTGCSEAATVTLTYHYALAQVWLDGLAADRDPHAYDLCHRHADRLTAPQGWHVRDRRPTTMHASQGGARRAYVA